MKLFNKPKWLKPEINETKYYLHIAIITIIILMTLKYIFNNDMLTIVWGLKLGIAIILGDIIAHSLLKLN